ncbi:hypothetical protein [Streptomyces rapamycinicus]|uniref:Uncharacterized protein n=2 Tax=Streptomyces rapamycinicus TaxID=1226757 RepID=A0A0A0NQQ9_STRRN|nr:hypothetical protein [Streptomyces rapamycinicus]AGP56825.1 hypothetical protein M271_26765 [Streptomyces rapamycinicus NRRL 5491]MBB4784440.1 hypothetical protein [Streptomyces rapamycinicus]RLV80077.1 hypothetical protein D3C57_116870 [Streptomyces rapamycinicus NRRL 5491]UTO64749.1 hypothetical protein LJB45_22080 [Streptomyces rapamycinicus]UTP32706.1 hypothetical protein LIV37_27205 [Streptomyces rapamycinicus NRRL 5491]
MGSVYATREQLATYTGAPAPEGAERLLARASEDIDAALLTAYYATDPDGDPTEQHVVDALRDATCAQVEYQLATGDDGTGAAGVWDAVSIGPVSLSGRRAGPPAASGVDLAPRAHRALLRAGLLPGVIW